MSKTNRSALHRLPANLQGMAWMFVTTIMIASMLTIIRDMTQQLHPFQVAFLRNLFGVPVVVALLYHYGWGLLKTERIGAHVVRSLGHVSAMSIFFVGLSMTPLATASALAFAAPLFAAALAMLLLGEAFRWWRWAALSFGFAGALVILRPGFADAGSGPLLVLSATFLWGTTLVIIKSLGRQDTAPTIVVYMIAFMVPLSLIPALFVWAWPTWEQLGLMAIVGIVITLAHLTLAQALRLGDTATVMPLDFFRLIWAALFGFLFLAEVPTIFTWIGGAMIFSGATYLAIRERADSRKSQTQRSLAPGD